jgi:hypothetical protein
MDAAQYQMMMLTVLRRTYQPALQQDRCSGGTHPSLAATLFSGLTAGQASSAGVATAVAAVDEAGLVDALLRYCYYKEVGIDARHVAPFREEWLGNALSMVPNKPPPNVSDVSRSICQQYLKGIGA